MRVPDTTEDPREPIGDFEAHLDEAEETLRALRGGEVDAIVTEGPSGDRIHTLKGADEVYRVVVEKMAKGALTLAPDGRRIREFTQKGGREFAPLNINAVILESITLARGELSKRQILPRFELANGLPAVLGDRIELQQVLLNLIMNAADAMALVEGPRELVVISRESPDGGAHPRVRVAVRDCGHGVRPEVLHKIFEPFFTTKPEGVGMGLSISRSIVEAHGGGMWAEAAEGPGLTIQFSLPAASENPS